MHGHIGVTSRIGEGSAFFVELPVADPCPDSSSADTADDHPAPPPAVSAPMKVMYVEDNPSNVKLVERVLALRPAISLIVAMQGRQAVGLAKDHLPDLVLLDLHLPDVSGEDVLNELKGDPLTAGIPVVMLSADATPGLLDRLVTFGGATGYLTKPIDVPRLLGVVDALHPVE